MKASYKRWFHFLEEPKAAFKPRPFDPLLVEYLKLLITASLGAAILSMFLSITKAAYFDVFFQADVAYWRLLNYALGQATAIVFLMLFIGTFGMFALSLILQPFLKVKYMHLLQLLLVAAAPVVLFGWLYMLIPGLLLWALVLFVIGRRTSFREKKHTIMERE